MIRSLPLLLFPLALLGCPGSVDPDGGSTAAGPEGCLAPFFDDAEEHRFEEVSLVGGDLITLRVVRAAEGGEGPPWALRAAEYQRGTEDPRCITEAEDLVYESSATGSSDALAVRVAEDTWARIHTEGQLDPFDEDGDVLKLDRFPLQLEDDLGTVTYGPVSARHEGPAFWPPVCPLDGTLTPPDGGSLDACSGTPGENDEVIELENTALGVEVTLARHALGEFDIATYQPFAATRFEVHGCGVDLCREADPPSVDTCVAIPCPVQTGELLYSVAYHNFTDWLRTEVGDVVLRLDTRLSALANGGWEYRLVALERGSGRVILGPIELEPKN